MAERQVKWSLRAINDKLVIYEYWANRNHSTAYPRRLEKLFSQIIDQVADYPKSGRKTDKDGVRVLTVNHFNLFYSFDETTVFVLTIFDTRQDEKKRKL